MNRNVESHFSELPSAEIQRSTFDRSASYKTSFNAGDLIPFYVDEVLPGDTFDISTAKVVRSQTMLTPVMDNIYLDTYYFFVPNRLIWKHWKEFCGENTAGAWAPTTEYTIPAIAAPAGGFKPGTIADYMGLPVNVDWKADDELSPSALPFRAYALICNEFFRDENLSDPLLIPMDDANQTGVNTGNYINDVANGGLPFKAAKYHDYFTSALPAPQKGQAVGIPITIPMAYTGGTYPVSTTEFVTGVTGPGSAPRYPLQVLLSDHYDRSHNGLMEFDTTRKLYSGNGVTGGGAAYIDNENTGTGNWLTIANLSVTIPDPTGGNPTTDGTVEFSVNELRLAFAYQRFLESLARNGSRYTELLLGLFGVRSPDARLQRPEYLGGNRVPISVNEVTNNAQSETDFLGDLGAKSQTGDVNHDFVKSFTEHGYVIGLMVARYDHSYAQGISKFWTRKTFTDFYNPKFAHLGEVPIYQAEIYANNNFSKSKVFGYQEIWADYRYRPNMVTSEMRPNVENSLAYWHLADNYSEVPTLSDGWIREDPANVDRVLAVTSQVANQFWADVYVQNKCTRCMPMYSVPGMLSLSCHAL